MKKNQFISTSMFKYYKILIISCVLYTCTVFDLANANKEYLNGLNENQENNIDSNENFNSNLIKGLCLTVLNTDLWYTMDESIKNICINLILYENK